MIPPFILLLFLIINSSYCEPFEFDFFQNLDPSTNLTEIINNNNNSISNNVFKVQNFDSKSSSSSSSSSSSGEGLQEFTPIRDTILQSETKYYSFSVNTKSGIGDFYELLIFLSGNICTQPSNLLENDTSLAVYYSFNSTMFTNNEIGQMQLFKDGFFQGLADLPLTETTTTNNDTTTTTVPEKILYIAVRAPENTNRTAQWTYQIGVSQHDLVFQWDDRSWGSIVDVDDNSALIVTGNLTKLSSGNYSDLNATNSQFSLYLYSYDNKDYFQGMNNSWCAVRSGPVLVKPEEIETKFIARHGSIQQQFMVNNLNASTKYIAYIVMDFEGVEYGGAVLRPFEFETMDGTACELIYDLEFCDQVAYSVPAIGNSSLLASSIAGADNKTLTKKLYDDYAKSLYTNFSKGLQQIACDTVPEAIYSNLKSCQDCAQSYKNWLCAVTIPRCSTKNFTGYIHRNETNQRNEFLADVIQPNQDYYEVLPCVNVCQAIVRDCPANFGFLCPTKNDSIKLSYYWDVHVSDQWPSCNYLGPLKSSKSGAIKLIINWTIVVVSFTLMVVI
ncbi:hypothetical protein L150_04287 [Candida albicans Ca529L]|nr:calcium channel MID1 [Candida albicans P94015]RLP65515.1 hypothetical protein L150_04287 [Candida albicans Ca529L]